VVDFDIVALPSFREPFGRTIIEGMALGRPVVSCASGGVLEIVTDGHDGLLVPPGDVTALANALIRLIENPDERNTLGMAAATTARERFDVAVLSRQIQKIILEAIVSE
jgi:glycosyltransferase involved in cell wall biosynthesis